VFWEAADVVPVLLIAIVLQAWAAAQDIGIIISERTKWIAAANWAGAAVVLAAYALLIPRYAAWGAAIATVIGYAVRYGLIFLAAQRLWPIRYSWGPVWRLVVLALGAVAVGVLLPQGPLALAVVSRAGVFFIYLWLVWKLPILSEDDRQSAERLMAGALESLATLLRRNAEVPAP
jgi:O-antigen/teichoic acid export membrane protein